MTGSDGREDGVGIRVAVSILVFSMAATGGCGPVPDDPERQVLHRGNGPDPGTLDPHRQYDESAGRIVTDLYEGLVRNGPDGRVLSGVARTWRTADDGLTWWFDLRDDARWCNGDAVTAGDFVAGLRRAMDPAVAAPYARLLEPITGIDAPDDATLVLTLARPAPALLDVLALPVAFPAHPSAADVGEAAYREPLGNGAYCFAERRPQSHVRLDRNPFHPDAAVHAIDTVYYHTIEDLDAELSRYRAGGLHVTVSVPPSRIPWIQQNRADELQAAPILASAYLGFNLAMPPFRDNELLRRALSLAIDRDRLAHVVFDGLVEPASGLVPPMTGYPSPDKAWLPADDADRIAAAQAAYRAAGYGDDEPLVFTLHYPGGGPSPRIAMVLSAMWRETLGVQVEMNQMEWRVYLAMIQAGETPGLYRYAWGADYADPAAFLRVFQSDGHENAFGYSSDAFDELLARADLEADNEARRALLSRAEALLIDDVAFIPLYFDTSRRLVSPEVQGWQSNPLDHHPTRNLSLRAR